MIYDPQFQKIWQLNMIVAAGLLVVGSVVFRDFGVCFRYLRMYFKNVWCEFVGLAMYLARRDVEKEIS